MTDSSHGTDRSRSQPGRRHRGRQFTATALRDLVQTIVNPQKRARHVHRWLRPRQVMPILLAVALLYVAFLATMFVVMRQPPQRFGQIMAYVPMPLMSVLPFETMWNVARGGTARVGDMAPDFDLPTVDRRSRVTLSSFRGKQPVILVFGSYT